MDQIVSKSKFKPNALKYFREEYEAHLNGSCPTGKCKDLVSYSVNDNCIGCTDVRTGTDVSPIVAN